MSCSSWSPVKGLGVSGRLLERRANIALASVEEELEVESVTAGFGGVFGGLKVVVRSWWVRVQSLKIVRGVNGGDI